MSDVMHHLERTLARIEKLLQLAQRDISSLQRLRNTDMIATDKKIVRNTDFVKERTVVILAKPRTPFGLPIQPLLHGRFLFTCQKCGIQWITTSDKPPARCQNPKSRHTKWWKPLEDEETEP